MITYKVKTCRTAYGWQTAIRKERIPESAENRSMGIVLSTRIVYGIVVYNMELWNIWNCGIYGIVEYTELWNIRNCGIYGIVEYMELWNIWNCGIMELWNIWNCGIYRIVKIGSKERKLNGVSLCCRTYFQVYTEDAHPIIYITNYLD